MIHDEALLAFLALLASSGKQAAAPGQAGPPGPPGPPAPGATPGSAAAHATNAAGAAAQAAQSAAAAQASPADAAQHAANAAAAAQQAAASASAAAGASTGDPTSQAHVAKAAQAAQAAAASAQQAAAAAATTPGTVAPAPTAPPGGMPAMPPWSTVPTVPASLPLFPGPGWVPDTPPSQAVQQRATYWSPILWNYATKTIVKPFAQENFGGRWMTFVPMWHPGDSGPKTYMAVEAWRLATDSALPASPTAPPPTPPPSAAPSPQSDASWPVPPMVSPYPGPGAWQTNHQYIVRLQRALAWLAHATGNAAFDPQKLDGMSGPLTQAAVKAFQTAHGLTADGEAGHDTAAAIDAAVTALAQGAPQAAA